MKITIHPTSMNQPAGRRGERGYALLGLLLALAVIGIYLVSSIVPNVKVQVQRSKEAEMIYRGNQMAKAIARYYGGRMLRPLQLQVPPPYGYLTELKKLRDGVTLGVQEVRFARASEMIDPMTGDEWEPVRARDPRINAVLQAYAAETGAIIPLSYTLLAGAPAKTHKINLGGSSDSDSSSSSQSDAKPGQPNGEAGTRPSQKPNTDPNDDDDDDDDDEVNDPLAHLFESDSGSSFGNGKSTVPIIGVAPKLKGKAVRPLYGLENYEQWVFIYIPENLQNPGTLNIPAGTQNQINNGNRVSP